MKAKISTKSKVDTYVAVAIFCLGMGFLAAGTFFDPSVIQKRVSTTTSLEPVSSFGRGAYVKPIGCYIDIDGGEFLINTGQTDSLQISSMCKNLFLTNYYLVQGGREDFYRLLIKETLTKVDLNKLNQAQKVKVFYQGINGKDNYLDYITKKSSSDKCEEMGFWGLTLRCFNEIVGSQPKSNHLPHILRYLTFLRYTENYQNYPAFSNLISHGVIIQDDSLNVCKEGGADLTPGDPMIMYLFKKNFEGTIDAKKIVHTAGVLYHESLHLINLKHYYRKINGICVIKSDIPELNQNPGKDENGCYLPSGVSGFDADWSLSMHKSPADGGGVSVYGGQVYYLSYLFKSSELSCEYRKAAFDDYNFNREKLCYPAPEFVFSNCQ